MVSVFTLILEMQTLNAFLSFNILYHAENK